MSTLISETFIHAAEIAHCEWTACDAIRLACGAIDADRKTEQETLESMKATLEFFRPMDKNLMDQYSLWWGSARYNSPDHQARILALCLCAAMTDDEGDEEEASGEALNLSSTISLDLGSF